MTRRLLYVVNIPEFFASHRLPVARAARDAGWEVEVAARGRGPDEGEMGPSAGREKTAVPPRARALEALETAGLPFHRLDFFRSGFHPLRDPVSLARLVRLYRELKPNLVHHVTYKPVVLGGIAARWTGVPAVVHAVPGFGHLAGAKGLRARLQRGLMRAGYRAGLRHPRQVGIFQNERDRARFLEAVLLAEEETELIAGSGVDVDRFRPGADPEDPPAVLMAARMLRTKGVDTFVEAARQLRAGGTDARFLLAGRTAPANPASVSAEELEHWSREGTVEWLGYREDVPELMARAAVVCLPSRYGEGVPKVLLEAAAAGRPAVTTTIPGCWAAVEDGATGLTVSPGDSEALARALGQLLEDPGLRADMGRRARERAEERFRLEDVVDRHLAIYDRLVPDG